MKYSKEDKPERAGGAGAGSRAVPVALVVVVLCAFSFYLGGIYSTGRSLLDSIQPAPTALLALGAATTTRRPSDDGQARPALASTAAVAFPECPADYQDYTPCTDPKRWRRYGNYRLSFMERHCPPPPDRHHVPQRRRRVRGPDAGPGPGHARRHRPHRARHRLRRRQLGRRPAGAGHPHRVAGAQGQPRGPGAVRAGARHPGHPRHHLHAAPAVPVRRLRHGALLALPHPLDRVRRPLPPGDPPRPPPGRLLGALRPARQLREPLARLEHHRAGAEGRPGQAQEDAGQHVLQALQHEGGHRRVAEVRRRLLRQAHPGHHARQVRRQRRPRRRLVRAHALLRHGSQPQVQEAGAQRHAQVAPEAQRRPGAHQRRPGQQRRRLQAGRRPVEAQGQALQDAAAGAGERQDQERHGHEHRVRRIRRQPHQGPRLGHERRLLLRPKLPRRRLRQRAHRRQPRLV
ncbi:hypothetical protein ZEAMMB73_Zm00001d030163 [Zea mays]|uniref:Uncharacterized protein n=1 Tax=Zea mays TaxID=4577 RepID=A0A1D6KAB0_MAIZE|nr:hypothetical protein ZEAMMB73_Zm00001d030163 [Zea mays]